MSTKTTILPGRGRVTSLSAWGDSTSVATNFPNKTTFGADLSVAGFSVDITTPMVCPLHGKLAASISFGGMPHLCPKCIHDKLRGLCVLEAIKTEDV